MDISKLIAEADSSEQERAEDALQELINLEIDAVQPIVEALNQAKPFGSRSRLNDVLLKVNDPEIVPLLVSSLDAKNIDLSMTAFEVLGHSGDERALSPLIERLVSSEQTSTRRRQSVHALGELGEQGAVEPLLNVASSILNELDDLDTALERLLQEVEEEWDVDSLRLIITIATSLAKLGNHLLASIVVDLTRFNPEESELDELDDMQIVRAEAAQALCHTVGSGMLPALQKAVREGNIETRDSALEALFYLGLPESIETLLSRTDDSSNQVANNALIWFNRLTGTDFEPFEDELADVHSWWDDHRSEYASGVCHRLGKPLSVEDVIEQLRVPNSTPDIVRELYIITGKDLSRNLRGSRQNEELFTLGQRWWNSQPEERFICGKLYKHGREQDLALVF